MKLKIPPALVAFLFGVMMWVIDNYISGSGFNFRWYQWLAVAFFVAGTFFGSSALIEFVKQKTTINPHNPEKSASLVTGGVYRVTRNAMYLGLLLWLAAFGFYIENLLSLIMLPFFVWYMNYFQIRPEEEILRAKFGEQFNNYCNRVRRWI